MVKNNMALGQHNGCDDYIRQIIERKRNMAVAFVDLEKAYDLHVVPREL